MKELDYLRRRYGGHRPGLLGARLTVRRSWVMLLACGACLIPMGLCLLGGLAAAAAFAVLTAAGFLLMACAALFTVTMLAHIQSQTQGPGIFRVCHKCSFRRGRGDLRHPCHLFDSESL